jgi:HK97 family phage prohead protease
MEFKAKADTMEFEGYASIFGNKDSGGDIMQKGAFKKTIQENLRRIKVLWNHDWNSPIGKPIEIFEDEKGLYVEAKISNTEKGKEIYELMKDNVIDEMSIGYEIKKDDYDKSKQANLLNEVKLYEFSPVTFAMNELAQVSNVKGLNNYLSMINNFDISTLDQNKIKQAIEVLKSLLIDYEPLRNTQKQVIEPIINDEKYDELLNELKQLQQL